MKRLFLGIGLLLNASFGAGYVADHYSILPYIAIVPLCMVVTILFFVGLATSISDE